MASTQPSLDALPPEFLELVVSLLNFRDICSLRLVSQAVATKSSQGVFKTYFASKTVYLASTEQMRELVALTQPNWMGGLLQSLTLVGIVSPTGPEHLPDEHPSGKLLGEAFTNLQLNSAQVGLQYLALLVEGRTESGEMVSCDNVKNWRASFNTAARTFEIASLALSQSALPVQELDVFGGVCRCSLACNYIAPVLDSSIDLSRSLNKLKRLTLNLASRVRQDPEDDESLRYLSAGQKHANDICRLLNLCPQLEVLELRWYKLGLKLNEAESEEQRFLTHVVQLEQLSQLHDCRLRGVHTDEATLLALLQKTTQLRRFTMEKVELESGRFEPVFKYLTSKMLPLDYLHLEDLRESRTILFNGPGKPRYITTSKSDNLPMTLTKTGKYLKSRRRTIGYRLAQGAPLGSAAFSKWLREATFMYGPPDFRGYKTPLKFLA